MCCRVRLRKKKEMEEKKYRVGTMPLPEWEAREGFPQSIVFTGQVTMQEFRELAALFDYRKYRYIRFENFQIEDVVYENGVTHSYEEKSFIKAYFDFYQFLVLEKLALNRSYTSAFVVVEDNIYSLNKKVLVHMPEMESVVIPDGVEEIGHVAFCGYEEVREVKFNKELKSIGKWAFVNVDIQTLEIPDTIKHLGEGAFYAANLEHLKISSSVEKIPWHCFTFGCFESIDFGDGIKVIEDCAFHSANFNPRLVIPEGVEKIGYDNFTGLYSIVLPSTLREIDPDFYYEECVDDPARVPYIRIHPDNPTFYSKDGTLYFRENGKMVTDCPFDGEKLPCRYFSRNYNQMLSGAEECTEE